MSFFGSILQDVKADSGNSSVTNITSGAMFTGVKHTTLGVAGIQVSLKTDKNCYVYVDQSPDGDNWDITDTYIYLNSLGGDSWTVQAVNSFTRVRVKNYESSPTTYLRLQTALCPIVEAIPRSLDSSNRLKTSSYIEDSYGFGVENTPMGEMRVSQLTKLVGSTFNPDSVGLDTNFFSTSVANNGTVIQSNGVVTLSTNTTANGSSKFYSVRRARYSAGSSMRYRAIIQLGDIGVTDNKRRWGIVDTTSTMPTITDEAYFQLNGGTFSVVTMKGGVETTVSSGNFNGDLGASYVLDTDVKTYEIYWTNSKVWYSVNGNILHIVSAASSTWSNSITPYFYIDNVNSNGVNTNQTIICRTVSIYRLGALLTQPISKYQSGTTDAIVCKYGPGNVHGLAISGVSNTSNITVYDSTTATGATLWNSGVMGAQTQPFHIPLWGVPFNNGLSFKIASANSTITIAYE
jgi:hypothetical protein